MPKTNSIGNLEKNNSVFGIKWNADKSGLLKQNADKNRFLTDFTVKYYLVFFKHIET